MATSGVGVVKKVSIIDKLLSVRILVITVKSGSVESLCNLLLINVVRPAHLFLINACALADCTVTSYWQL